MARLKPPKPPTLQQAPRCGIDTIYFTSKQVVTDSTLLLPWLQTFIDPNISDEHLTIQPGNGFYQQCISISGDIENIREFHAGYSLSNFHSGEPFRYSHMKSAQTEYTGTTTELLRIYFNPRPQGDKLYSNDTTSFQLKGELLRRIDYVVTGNLKEAFSWPFEIVSSSVVPFSS